ncbi:RHS repeat-associated core domain-containing protein [Cellulomonas chengniuliangii]|uniref:RHS repeat-associated core domain-containing protein n=1 Tax=Cellulomonas chengniuliangii TaxID=2968084 RepID=UPI001D0DD887|nr:RHS repeat-associated core domain-containing protein [Cellulomonas chengniuliangii]
MTDWADRDYTYTYDADGRTERDDAGQTLGITVAGSGIDLLELAYGYTDAGLLADQTTTRSTQSRAPPTTATTSSDFAWDDLGRIEQITGDDAGTFTFDAAGSVTTLADGRTLTYDTARQLTTLATPAADATSVTTTAFAYDARGNRATATTDAGPTAGTVGHTYNQANQLTSVTGRDGTTTSYTYAATGLRATATTGTAVEQYTWDTLAGIPLQLTDATHAYVYGNGSTPLAQVDLADASIDYLHTDALGSVRSTTDQTGTVTSDADYDAYGVPQAVTDVLCAVITRFGYAGEYADPTGYLYLRARYYDPTTAQFISVDRLVDSTLDAYGYADGNPLQRVDPTGLSAMMLNPRRSTWLLGAPTGNDSCSPYTAGGLGDSYRGLFVGAGAGVTAADTAAFALAYHTRAASEAGRNLANYRWQGSPVSQGTASASGRVLSSYSHPGSRATMNSVGKGGAVRAIGGGVGIVGAGLGGVQAYSDSIGAGEGSSMAAARASAAVAGGGMGLLAGMAAGSLVGSAVGSVVPGLGTVAGFVVGAAFGTAGAWLGQRGLNAMQDHIYY